MCKADATVDQITVSAVSYDYFRENTDLKAEGEGFEPTDALRHLRFSRPMEDSPKALAKKGVGDYANVTAPSTAPNFPKDLQEIIQAWADLPEAIRAGVMALVMASKPQRSPKVPKGKPSPQ